VRCAYPSAPSSGDSKPTDTAGRKNFQTRSSQIHYQLQKSVLVRRPETGRQTLDLLHGIEGHTGHHGEFAAADRVPTVVFEAPSGTIPGQVLEPQELPGQITRVAPEYLDQSCHVGDQFIQDPIRKPPEDPQDEIVGRLVGQSQLGGTRQPCVDVEPHLVGMDTAIRAGGQEQEPILVELPPTLQRRELRPPGGGFGRRFLFLLPGSTVAPDAVPVVEVLDQAGAHRIRHLDRLAAAGKRLDQGYEVPPLAGTDHR